MRAAVACAVCAWMVVGCGGPPPASTPLSATAPRIMARERPSASRYQEDLDQSEDSDPLEIQLEPDDDDDDDSVSSVCKKTREDAARACDTGSVICEERARHLGCREQPSR